jgi:lysophospholipase L1-like esterase
MATYRTAIVVTCIIIASWGLGFSGVGPGGDARADADSPAKILREPIEWLDVWIPDSKAPATLPRVLLIGDSITRAYYPRVEQLLAGKALVARLATSKAIPDPMLVEQVKLVLAETHFDVIHFNNGMHGWDYTEAEYAAHFPDLLAAIKNGAPGAKLIWATTTPVRQAGKLAEFTDRTPRVKDRNRAAAAAIAADGIPTDDLFTLVENHPEYWSKDGVHFNEAGEKVEAEQVAKSVLDVLNR